MFPGVEALIVFLVVALLYRPASRKNMKRRHTGQWLDALKSRGACHSQLFVERGWGNFK